MKNTQYLNKNRPIGFSTGCLYRVMNTYSVEAIELLARHSLAAIEVMCAYDEHVKLLPAMVPHLRDFKMKSVHLPVDIRYSKTREIRLMLGAIAEFYQAIGANLAVVHPDLVDDWDVFKGCPMNLAVENMDDRKFRFQHPQDFVIFFKKFPNWKFVLDLSHCYVNDKSLASVGQFVKLFGDRLAEIHLSGSGSDKYHKPLYLTDQVRIIKNIPAGTCPIIIESPFRDLVRGLDQELKFINFNM